VRFNDFTNTKDGNDAGNLYLQDNVGYLGATPGLDGRARVQASPHWVAGLQSFSFAYSPVDGATDLVLAQAANMTSAASRVISDPTKSVNFISFYILNQTAGSGDITLNLTDLDGNALAPSAFTLSASAQNNWYLTDPTLLANGFILSGSINLVDPRNAGETDKIEIAFGNTAPVPEPLTMTAAFLAIGGLGSYLRKRSRLA
jgi:hypothetical protein